MSLPITRSEELTHKLCTHSFLSLWCFNNPRGKKNNELCDVLVVCDPDIIIFSVKEIKLRDANNQTQHARWQRRAVDASIGQLYGAATWLGSAKHVTIADGSSIELPQVKLRRVHRVAVAFGDGGSCSVTSGDFGKGHVHVFTEGSLFDILRELDTIADFVQYLSAKEAFLARCSIAVIGGESSLLGLYILNGRAFPSRADFLVIEEGIWDTARENPEYINQKAEDAVSYVWDELIEFFSDNEGHEHPEYGLNRVDRELVVRGMARETRLSRRLLASGFLEFLENAKDGRLRSRVLMSISRNIYVFAYFLRGEQRVTRLHELYCRCLIAKSKLSDAADNVIGIAFNEFDPNVGFATDFLFVQVNTSNNDWRDEAIKCEGEYGYFGSQPVR